MSTNYDADLVLGNNYEDIYDGILLYCIDNIPISNIHLNTDDFSPSIYELIDLIPDNKLDVYNYGYDDLSEYESFIGVKINSKLNDINKLDEFSKNMNDEIKAAYKWLRNIVGPDVDLVLENVVSAY